MILKFDDFSKVQKKAYEETLGNKYDLYRISETLPDYLYVCFRALTADVPNMNWDQFDTEELERHDDYLQQKVYETFNGKSIFTNHQSNKVENSIGVIFDSIFNKASKDDRFVEIIFGIDKEKASDISRGVETGRLAAGSMGCQIAYSVCSNCGKEVYTEDDVCDHLKSHRGQIIEGQRIAERLRGVSFQEYSIVTVGADPKAKLRYIVSSIIGYKRLPKVADQSDIFTLMKILAEEVNGASLHEKMQISKNLDEVVANIEGKNIVLLSTKKFSSLDDDINYKLGILFQYVRDTQNAELGGPVQRSSEIDLRDLIGKNVEIDKEGKVLIV